MNVNTRTERNANLWVQLIELGRPLDEVAAEFKISRSRVRDLVVREGTRRRYKVQLGEHRHPVRSIQEVRAVWLSLQPKVRAHD